MKYLFLVLLLSGCTVIGPGERGVRVILGEVSEDVKAPGPYLWVPVLFGMATLDVQIQKTVIEAGAASKDMQDVTAQVAINWVLSPEKVVATYTEIGDNYEVVQRILIPAVAEVLKASTSKRNAEQILTQRLEMKKDIDAMLEDRLGKYGIEIKDISIADLKFSPEFSNAIESKQIAEQQAKQASYVADKAIQEARAQVERAKGQNESQKLLQATTSAAILQKAAIDKWDGHFPQVMGAGALPFININLKAQGQ